MDIQGSEAVSAEPWPTGGATGPAGPWPDPPGASPAAAPPPAAEPDLGSARIWIRVAIAVAVVGLAVNAFGPGAFAMILALFVSVVLHEFGHYWTARRCGMKVTEFFIGLGPRIWSFHRGEVEYGIKAVPVAAYVKIAGMSNLDEVDEADEPRVYRSQSTPKRVAAVIAGPAANMLVAFTLLLGTFFFASHPTDAWTVGDVTPGGAAANAGLVHGDRLLEINGSPVGDFDSFRGQIDDLAGEHVELRVRRDGEIRYLETTLGWRLDPVAAALVPSSPALSPGDQIVALDGAPLASYAELRSRLGKSGTAVTLSVVRGKGEYRLEVARPLSLPADGSSGFLGVTQEPVRVRETPVGAVGEASRTAVGLLAESGAGLVRLLSPAGISSYAGQVADATTGLGATSPDTSLPKLTPVNGSPAPEALPGEAVDRPVSLIGIVSVGSQAADQDLVTFFMFVAVVNLALAVFNLLPVLPFDGGHVAIALYEGVRSRIQGSPYRADIAKMLPIFYGVLSLLALLTVTSVMLDIVRPFAIR